MTCHRLSDGTFACGMLPLIPNHSHIRMFTHDDLEKMHPGTIFAKGHGKIDGRTFSWVAVRGQVDDWAIYTTLNSVPGIDFWVMDDEGIHKHGQKVYDSALIMELVACDGKMLARYRR